MKSLEMGLAEGLIAKSGKKYLGYSLGCARTSSISSQISPDTVAEHHPVIRKFTKRIWVVNRGCRAAAFAISGQLNAQDESCPVWKRRSARTL